MDEDRIKGNWKQFRGKLKAKWGELTDDELDQAEGNAEYLIGRIQERYGLSKEQARKEFDTLDRD